MWNQNYWKYFSIRIKQKRKGNIKLHFKTRQLFDSLWVSTVSPSEAVTFRFRVLSDMASGSLQWARAMAIHLICSISIFPVSFRMTGIWSLKCPFVKVFQQEHTFPQSENTSVHFILSPSVFSLTVSGKHREYEMLIQTVIGYFSIQKCDSGQLQGRGTWKLEAWSKEHEEEKFC